MKVPRSLRVRKKGVEDTDDDDPNIPNTNQTCPPKPKKAPPRKKLIRPPRFTIADDNTLKKILSPPPKPVPEFQGKTYIRGTEPLLYQCKEHNCNAAFTNHTSLLLHSNKHLDRTIRCQFCGLLFIEENDLLKHKQEFHPDTDLNPDADPLKCRKCGKRSRDKRALWRHVRESHRKEEFLCPHCNFQFTRPENLKDHLRSKHPSEGQEPRFACKTCGKVYAHHNSLTTHIRDTHRGGQTPLKCCICDTVHWTRVSYWGHMKKNHTSPKFIQCITCNATFSCMDHLRRHKNSIRHKKKVQIERKTARISARKDFQRNSGSSSLKTAPNKKLDSDSNLTTKSDQDQLIHFFNTKTLKIILHRVDQRIVKKSTAKNAQRKYVYQLSRNGSSSQLEKDNERLHLDCVYCDKAFRDLKSVKAHEIICYMKYRYAKLHICPTCNKEFDKAYKLKLHSRVHSNERPYQCAYCDKTFKSTHTLVQHEKSLHFGIRCKPAVPRVYGCNYAGCGKQYKTDKSLHKHISSNHLGIRFKCDKCERVYQRKDYLRKHLRIDHAECPVRLGCQPCKRTYKDRLTYLNHLKTPRHHRKVLEFEKAKKGNKK